MSTTTIKDGGPAFPQGPWEDAEGNVETANPGMTLRDYFAAAALPAFIARLDINAKPTDALKIGAYGHAFTKAFRDAASKEAFAVADAMLAAREAKPQ